MKSVGIFSIAFSMLAFGTTVACSVDVPEQGQNDEATSVDATAELLASIRATPETERLTGVFAWEVSEQGHDLFVIGLDRQGVVVLNQKTALGADGALAVEVTHPSLHKFTVDASGNKVELVAASPQVRLLLERAALDVAENQAKEAQTQEYSACGDIWGYATACLGATGACAAAPGILKVPACGVMVSTCYRADYCLGQCHNGYKTCDGSSTDNQLEDGDSCAANDQDCDGVPDDSGGSNASAGSDSQGNYGE
jgi:hypothetical protein